MTQQSRLTAGRALVVLGVLLMAGSLVGGALAAAPTVDVSTTNSSTTSDLTGGTNITGFEANSSNTSALEYEVDSTNTKVEFIDPETDAVLLDYTASEMNQTYSDAANNTYNYRIDINHSEFDTVPMASGENKSVTVKLINNTSVSSPDTTTFTIYFENVDDRTVLRMGDAAADDGDLTLETEGYEVPVVNYTISEDEVADYTKSNVEISNASEHTITLHAANSTADSRLGSAAEDVSDGEWVQATLLEIKADDTEHGVPVFADSAPDEIPDNTAYAVQSGDQITIHTNSDSRFDDADSVEVQLRANDGDFFDQRVVYGSYAVVTGDAFGLGLMDSLPFAIVGLQFAGLGLIVSGRRIGGDA